MSNFPSKVRPLVQGTPWGETFPPRSPPPPIAIDGRTAALHVLRDYVCALNFYRYMGAGRMPAKFNVTPDNFYIEWPDSTEDMVTPSIAIVHDRADYDVIGLVSYIEENTHDVYAPGTVLQWQAEYVETINLEIWASKQAERRAILAGLEISFSPTEQMSGVRFIMPEYFNELVCFTLMRREIMDEPDSARNRRKAQIELQMRFNIVTLVNVNPLQPVVGVSVDVDQDTQLPIDLTQDLNAQLGPDLQAVSKQVNQIASPNPLFRKRTSSYNGGGGNHSNNP